MRGFSLIESILYIALFSIVLSGILKGFWSLAASADRNQTYALVEIEGDFLLGKINYDIAHAKKLFIPENKSSSETLSIISILGTSVNIYLQNGAFIRKENDVALPLSSDSITASALLFTRDISEETDPASIKTSFELSATSSDGQPVSEDFSSVTYLFP